MTCDTRILPHCQCHMKQNNDRPDRGHYNITPLPHVTQTWQVTHHMWHRTNSLLCATAASSRLLCLLDWTPESLQTNLPAMLFFRYFHSLSSLCVHAWWEIFFSCCTIYLEQSPLKSEIIKHTHSFQIIFEISSLQAILPTLCVCVCVCVRACVRARARACMCAWKHRSLFWLCLSSLLCNGLCAPIKKFSQWKSTVLL